MKKAGKPQEDDAQQSKRFIEAAKKAKADESKEGADRAFKKVTARKPAKAKRPS